MKKIKSYEQLCLFVSGLADSYADSAIILYNLGEFYVAIGEAAVMLYKKFGWDFKETHVLDRQSDRFFTLVTQDGLACINRNLIKWVVKDTGFQLDVDCSSAYTDTQQFLERLRTYLNEREVFTYPFIRETVVLNTEDYQRVARLTKLIIDRNTIKAELDNRDILVIANNMEWDFKQISISLMRALHKIVNIQHDFIISLAHDREMTEDNVRMLNTAVYVSATNCKSSLLSEIVLVKQRGFLIAFDDDAIIIASKLTVPLYECQTHGTRNHTAVVITPNEFKALTDMDINIHCITTNNIRSMYEFCLSSDIILNLNYDKSIIYDDVAVMKDVTSNYMIKASYGGTAFEPVQIPNKTGVYLHSLPIHSLEYKQMLTCIAHQAFDKRVSAINQQQNEEE